MFYRQLRALKSFSFNANNAKKRSRRRLFSTCSTTRRTRTRTSWCRCRTGSRTRRIWSGTRLRSRGARCVSFLIIAWAIRMTICFVHRTPTRIRCSASLRPKTAPPTLGTCRCTARKTRGRSPRSPRSSPASRASSRCCSSRTTPPPSFTSPR